MKKLEHIGIAVLDLEAAEKIFSDVLGEVPYKREVVDSESVLTSFFHAGDSKIELLQSTSADGPIIREWITFYNTDRPHTALDKRTPEEAYFDGKKLKKAA